MSGRILAFDQSAYCGWAHGVPGEKPMSGTLRLPDKQVSDRLIRLENFVMEMVEANKIERVYFEKPIIPKVTSFLALSSLIGYASYIGTGARRAGIQSFAIDMQTWRSEFGVPTQAPRALKGKDERRKWVKAATMARCERLGIPVADDNAADAVGIWYCAAERILHKARNPSFDIFAGVEGFL
jgi:hypothetical protein